MSYHLRKTCRACGSSDLEPVFNLGLQPLANEFRKSNESRSGFFPLSVVLCPKCSLSQLSVVVNPETLYRHYAYTTSSSETMRRHFERLFQDLESEGAKGTIVEIGSNDGRCLKFAMDKGYRVIGIEPANNLAGAAWTHYTITTIPKFFDQESAMQAKDSLGHPSVILARHCFAHADKWREWIAGFEVLSDKRSVIAIELPYVHDTLNKVEFDQLYHEHLSYVSLTALFYLLRSSPFHIHRVIRYGIHGGSLLVMLRHKDSKIQPHLSADEYLAEDLVTLRHWQEFATKAQLKIQRMRDTVHDLVSKGNRVCGFGASAKATVWIHACGFREKDLLFVSDNSPLKPGTLMPGTNIPVIAQDELLSDHPDYACCFAWNYKTEILETQSKWRQRGGKFIFPLSDGVEIV